MVSYYKSVRKTKKAQMNGIVTHKKFEGLTVKCVEEKKIFQVVVYKCLGNFVVYCKLIETRTCHAKHVQVCA